jgi:gliding motility-associated protein GldM
MAGQKETPRQKMIGLMYLVLMAMLALNVSKDILDSFVQVDKSLLESIENSNLKTDQLYADIEMSKQYDPVRAGEAYEKAHNVKGKASIMIDYIQELKKRLMVETDGLPYEVGDTLRLENVNGKDNFDVPTHIMIGLSDDGSAGISSELKTKIEAYRGELIGLLPEEDQESANIGLVLKGGVEDGQKLNWEMNTFYHTTLAATIVHLTKLQNDIKNAELDVVSKIYATVGKVDIQFDTVAPKVVAPTNYVLLGEEYKADIFLAAFNKTKDPKISINESQIPVRNGLGLYSLKTSKEGAFTYNGTIEVETNSGELKKFPFESNYIVARPALTVSPTKMNVLYIGLTNPVSVSVPGVAVGNMSVSISGGGNKISATGSGNYKVNLAKNSPKDVKVSVTATMQDGSKKSMGSVAFRVKRLPRPTLKVLGKTTDAVISKNTLLMLKSGVSIYDNFEFDIAPESKGFTVTLYRNGLEPLEATSTNKIVPAKIIRALRSMKSRDRIVFSYAQAKGPDGVTHKISGLTLKVK